MFDDTVVDVERKAIILALAEISKNIKIDVDMVGNQDNSNVYKVLSNDESLSINIDFNNENSNSFEDLKSIVEYLFKEMEYAITEIKDDYDALENATKLFNALVIKMGDEKNWTVDNCPSKTMPNSIYNSLIEAGNKLTSLIEEVKHEEERITLILCRHMIDNIIHELLFVDSSDLLDFLSATRLLADIVPMFF